MEKDVVDKITKMVEKTTEIEVKFSHRITLTSLELRMMGSTITCSADFGLWLKGTIVRSGLVPVGPSETADGKLKLTLSKSVSWDGAGKLVLAGGETKISIDGLSDLKAFPKIDPGRVIATGVVLDIVGRVLNGEVGNAISDRLPNLQSIANSLVEPHKVQDLGSISLNPHEVHLYPIIGSDKELSTTVAIQCRPTLRTAPERNTRPTTPASPIAFIPKTGPVPSAGFHLELQCLLDNDWIDEKLTEHLTEIVQPGKRALVTPAGDGVALIQAPLDSERAKKQIQRLPGGKFLAPFISLPDIASLWGELAFTEQHVIIKQPMSLPSIIATMITLFHSVASNDEGGAAATKVDHGVAVLVFELPPKETLAIRQSFGIGTVSLLATKQRITEVFLTTEQLKVVVAIDGETSLSVKAQ